MELKKRAVRHQTSEWIRVTLRVDPENKKYLKGLSDDIGISQNLLINKIIDCFREIDSASQKTIGTSMIVSFLKKDSSKYDTSHSEIDLKLEQIKKRML